MDVKPFTLAGVVRSAMRCIGQAPQRTRWTDLAHRRPVFRARRTSLCSTCGRSDQGVKHAWPANAKNRSNESIITSFGITTKRSNGPSQDSWTTLQESHALITFPSTRSMSIEGSWPQLRPGEVLVVARPLPMQCKLYSLPPHEALHRWLDNLHR